MNILNDYTFQVVVIGATLLGGLSGILGSFAVLRKQSLLGDGISHSALMGVILAFMITGSTNVEVLLLGGLISGVVSVVLVNRIIKTTKIKFDSALALIMSVFFGMGVMLLSYVQKYESISSSGIERFIYGQASAMLLRDVKIISICGVILVGVVVIFWKEFKLLTFDKEFAQSIGYDVFKLDLLLTILTVITIIIGLQTVGVILMSSMLIAPVVGARQWVNSLSSMVILSSIFGGVSGIIGTVISVSYDSIPTGPVIVIVATSITIISMILNKGHL